MILFIGGAWQNKKETALRITGLSPDCVTDGAVCGPDEIFHARIIDHFHMYLLEAMRRGGQHLHGDFAFFGVCLIRAENAPVRQAHGGAAVQASGGIG